MMKTILKLTVMLLIFFIEVNSIKSQTLKSPYVPGQLIVKFKAGKTAKTNHLITQLNARVIKSIANDKVELWQVDNNMGKMDLEQLVESYKDHPDIEYIEPNYLYTTSEVQVPNDSDFSQQWALHNTGELEGSVEDADIDAPEAWEIQSESPSIVVGIIDTGVDWRHPDLIDNIWQNLAEDANGNGVVLLKDSNGNWIFDPEDENGIDDDGNGYVDDFIGWNFIDNNNKPFDYEAAADGDYVQSHGTHVAGIIGANGNNGIGVTGVTAKVQLAVLKFLSDDVVPKGSAANATEAITYAYNMKMQISNNSWGGSNYSWLIDDAIKQASANNHLFVAAAGNGGEDKIGDNIDGRYPSFYPAQYGYNHPIYDYYSNEFNLNNYKGNNNIITVANTTNSDVLAPASNFGANAVDIAAPGTNIYGCLPFGYGWLSGTSMATPHVTGACALLWERGTQLFESVKYETIKDMVLNNSDAIPSLNSKIARSGRLNVHQSLIAIEQPALSNLYQNCIQRDSLIVRNLYNSLNARNWDLTQPLDTWAGVRLNSMGCVTNLTLNSNTGHVWVNSTYQDTNEPIKAQILSELSELSELTELVIYNTVWKSPDNDTNTLSEDVYSSLPEEIGNLHNLRKLSVTGQLLKGKIPTEISKLTQLRELILNDNQLTGTIPADIMNLSGLQTLNLSSNKLEGSIPLNIDKLKSLMHLFLSNNSLSGAIPNPISHLGNLHILDLAYNNLSGSIPPEIGYIKWLYFTLLNNNELSGSIPPEFYYLSLEFQNGINISHNKLSGCYDPSLAYIGELSGERSGAKSGYGNGQISDGNNFDATWIEFIETEAGSCWASEVTRVWPGDINNDGVVNQKDILFYGLVVGNTGPTREGADINNVGNTNWTGQLCPDWENQVYGINGKFQDADGNGLVDSLDYAVILENWGLENPAHRKESDNLTYVSNGVELILEPVEDEAVGTYDLYLKKIGSSASPVYGIAGEIAFNVPLSPYSEIIFDNSCLATDETYANFEFNFDKTILEFGITQTDNVNIVCEEALARIVVLPTEYEGIEGGVEFLTFKVNGITSETNGFDSSDINQAIGSSMSQYLYAPLGNNLNVMASTNPQLCSAGGKATAYVSGGTRPYQYLWSTGETTNKIVNLEAGIHTLIVNDAEGISDTLTVEVEDQQLPEYDEDGELIDCEMIIETNCANNIDFDRYITNENNHIMEQGFYAANKNIYSSAKILENKAVDLQAGEGVILKPGFTMENNTELNVIIQNCNEE